MTAGKYTLAALIAFANDEGLLINNLFQLDDGAWRASLRSIERTATGEYFHEFGEGATHKEALFNALEKVR